MSRAIVDTLVNHSAEALLDAASDHDGHDRADRGRYLQRAASTSGGCLLMDIFVRLDRPLIGLGAPASAYYPAVAARLGTRAVVPEHAGVANAVGTVVGRVRARTAGTIAMPEDGGIACSWGASAGLSRTGDRHRARERRARSAGTQRCGRCQRR